MKVEILRQADWLPTLEAFRLPKNGRGNIDYYLEFGEIEVPGSHSKLKRLNIGGVKWIHTV